MEKIVISALQIAFAIMEMMGKSEEEQEAFIQAQRVKFRSENAPENLPKPPTEEEG